MPRAADRDLDCAMKLRQFAPVYYLYGDDDFRKDASVRVLLETAVDQATREFNVDVLRGGEVGPETLEVTLATPPMMAERRLVIVRDVPALKKDARRVLERYLERPAVDALVVLVAGAGAKADKVLAEATMAVEFAPLRGDDVTKWMREYAASTLGVEASGEAINLLQQVVGPDLPQLASELEKLGNYTAGGRIERDAVTAVVGIRHGETLGDLLDAVAQRNAARALTLVPYVLAQPRLNGVQVIMALSTQMLAIAWGKAARGRGLAAHALSSEYYSLLKEAGAFPGRPWGEAVSAWVGAVPLWNDAQLDGALDLLVEADRSAKDTRLSSEEQLVSTVVLSLCGLARRAA